MLHTSTYKNHPMPHSDTLIAFLAASFLLAITPGPVVLYIVARSLAQGRVAGLVSALGGALGNLGNAAAAALGLSALFALSSLLFEVVKLLGAAYLIYLGVRHLRRPRGDGIQGECAREPLWRVFRDAWLVALLNPKTTLFFAAFLPQFMSHDGSPISQGLALGALFVAIALCTDSLYAWAAGWVAPRLRHMPGIADAGRRVAGAMLIVLGIFAALARRT